MESAAQDQWRNGYDEAVVQFGRRLTGEDLVALRRPFNVRAVGFVPLGGVRERQGVKTQEFGVYMDARLVTERLNDIDPCWTAVYERVGFAQAGMQGWAACAYAIDCHLTVRGVTRTGVGQLRQGAKQDDKHIKAAQSDALKRAAVEFGVGAYLYALDNVQLAEQIPDANGVKHKAFWHYQRDNKTVFGGLEAAGKAQLRAIYERVVSAEAFIARFGEPVDYGHVLVDEEADSAEPDAATGGVSDAAIEVLMLLQHATGRRVVEDAVKARIAAPGFDVERELAMLVRAVGKNLSLDPDVLGELERVTSLAVDDEHPSRGELLDQLTTILSGEVPGADEGTML